MNYTKKQFGKDLKKKLSSGYNIIGLARWTHRIFLEHCSHLEPELQEILMQLIAMEEGTEFEFSEKELIVMAEKFISGDVQRKYIYSDPAAEAVGYS